MTLTSQSPPAAPGGRFRGDRGAHRPEAFIHSMKHLLGANAANTWLDTSMNRGKDVSPALMVFHSQKIQIHMWIFNSEGMDEDSSSEEAHP